MQAVQAAENVRCLCYLWGSVFVPDPVSTRECVSSSYWSPLTTLALICIFDRPNDDKVAKVPGLYLIRITVAAGFCFLDCSARRDLPAYL
jgi:hypothetical protein